MHAGATPNAPIQDYQTTPSSVSVDRAISADRVSVNLDIVHKWRGDLVVSLTSPSKKSYRILNRDGGSAENVQGTFDLPKSAFEGENAKGEWILTVEDKEGGDQGVLRGWELNIDGIPMPKDQSKLRSTGATG